MDPEGSASTVNVSVTQLRGWIEGVLGTVGVSAAQSHSVADALAEADARGAHTHGLEMLPRYVGGFQAGELNRDPHPRRVFGRGAAATWDGDNGLGHYSGDVVTEQLSDQARTHGIVVAAVRNSNHFGIAARYVRRLAREGLVGFITTNTPPVMPVPGGREVAIGNNPMAWGIPRAAGREPIVMDMAVSAVARGKVRLAASAGELIPIGWALGPDGEPTTDAAAALQGVILPMADYKGYGMAVIHEMLAGALSASRMLTEISQRTITVGDLHDRWGIGHFIMALDPDALLERGQFNERVESAVGVLISQRTRDGSTALLPGEPEARIERASATGGINFAEHILEPLDRMARTLQVDPLVRGVQKGADE